MNVQEVVYCREEEKEERKEEKEEEEMLFIQVIKIHYASTSCIYLHVLGDETLLLLLHTKMIAQRVEVGNNNSIS
jgi:hypothetical protein